MALTGNASNTTMLTNTAFAVPNSYSFAFWYKPRRVPGSSPNTNAFLFGSGTGAPTVEIGFLWSHSTALNVKTFIHRESGGLYKRATLTSTPAAETYHHLCGTYDATNMRVYLNGSLQATTAAAVSSVTNSKISLLSFFDSANWDDATIAEFGLWNVALSAGEITGLNAGVCPIMVRPSALLTYAPLHADSGELMGRPMTLTGTSNFTSHAHPKIFYPRPAYIQHTADGATYHHTCSDGVTVGGSSTAVADYVIESSGGVTVAGTSNAGMDFVLSDTVSVSLEDPSLRDVITVAQTLREQDWYAQVEQSVTLRPRMRIKTPFLATGQYRR